jgi:hypothetical protein
MILMMDVLADLCAEVWGDSVLPLCQTITRQG